MSNLNGINRHDIYNYFIKKDLYDFSVKDLAYIHLECYKPTYLKSLVPS